MAERREKQQAIPGPDRRERPHSYSERRQDFALLREKALLIIGSTGLAVITLTVLTLVVLGVDVSGATPILVSFGMIFAGILGTPLMMAWDERRSRDREGTYE